MNWTVPLQKIDAEQRIVQGVATTEALDRQKEIVAIGAIEKALDEYKRFPTIREMHQPSAVGKALDLQVQDGKLRVVGKVVDDRAWQKVKEGVYTAFSIGGSVLKSEMVKMDGQDVRKITALRLTEISLVDSPANPEARIELWKLDKGVDMSQVLDLENLAKADDDGDGMDDDTGQPVDADQDADVDVDPDNDGDIDVTSTPLFILQQLQSMRNAAEQSGDLDTAATLHNAVSSLAQARVNDPAEDTPGAPGQVANDQGGTSAPASTATSSTDAGAGAASGSADAGGSAMAMAQTLGDLVKAAYGAGVGAKGANVKKPKTSKGVPQGGKNAKKPGGLANLNGPQVNNGAIMDGIDGAKKPGKPTQGTQSYSSGSVKADTNLDIMKAGFDTIAQTLSKLSERLERLEAQPREGGPVLKQAEKSFAGQAQQSTTPIGEKIATLRKMAAETTDPFEQQKYQELLFKAEYRRSLGFVD